jgi:hypothetical protein
MHHSGSGVRRRGLLQSSHRNNPHRGGEVDFHGFVSGRNYRCRGELADPHGEIKSRDFGGLCIFGKFILRQISRLGKTPEGRRRTMISEGVSVIARPCRRGAMVARQTGAPHNDFVVCKRYPANLHFRLVSTHGKQQCDSARVRGEMKHLRQRPKETLHQQPAKVDTRQLRAEIAPGGGDTTHHWLRSSGRCTNTLLAIPAFAQGCPGKILRRQPKGNRLRQLVLAGLDPAIHAFGRPKQRRGCADQVRAKRP